MKPVLAGVLTLLLLGAASALAAVEVGGGSGASPSMTPIESSGPSSRSLPRTTPQRVDPTHGTTPTPTPTLPSSLTGGDWTKLPTRDRVVALTFDAGANADAVPSILATLAAKGVPGTFFLTGRWVQVYPALARQIGARYPVGNHSFDHPDLTTLGDAAATHEILAGGAAIAAESGADPKPLFRFPFGASSAHLVSLANSLGYGCIRWTVDTLGWEGTSGGQTEDSVVSRALSSLQPGEIVIMHVGSHPTDHSTLDADALPTVIDEIRARGYSFVTVDSYL
jgi:peptidoglycan/xylan/chitin deacetylase (PgdA/CDA1 family)